MKVLVGPFNQVKALVGAFSMIVILVMCNLRQPSFEALVAVAGAGAGNYN